MAHLNDEDLAYVWRTNGGLYVSFSGSTGKLCSFRESSHGVNADFAHVSVHSQVIYTRYGKRFRPVDPEEVRAGQVIRIETLDAGGLQTSMIHETYAGVRVEEITPDGLFLVFDEHRAALVAGDELSTSIPLLAHGWNGAAQPLWELDLDDCTILRVDKFDNLLNDSPRLNTDIPGWDALIRELRDRLEALSSDVKVTGVWSGGDGELVLRLEGLHPSDHIQWQIVLDTVRAAEQTARRTCIKCSAPGSIRRLAGTRGEPFGYALCDECALGKYMQDEVLFPPPTWTVLPESTAMEDVMVEPAW